MSAPIDLIGKLVLLLAIATSVLVLLSRLRLPTVVGYLCAGVLLGPGVLGLIARGDAVSTLAEIGVLLLMFTLGLEFDTSRFGRFRRVILGGGALQVGLTILCAISIGALLGWPPRTSLFLGCIVALSSTAVVLKSLMQEGLLDTLPGRLTVGILIFQDLSVVPMMILLPIGGATPLEIAAHLGAAAARAAVLLAITLLMSRWLMPRLLHVIASGRSKELFLVATLTICFGVAWMSHALGVSYALGAFLAGLILGGSEYAQQITADIVPFREVLSGVFFISMGMLLDPAHLAANWQAVLVLLAIILVVKTAVTAAAVGRFGYPGPVALQVGINLAQIGEFSFLIALLGVQSGLISQEFYQVAIGAAVASMILAPILMRSSSTLASAAARLTGSLLPRAEGPADAADPEPEAKDHILILGYGTVGRTLGEVLTTNRIPFVALEIDPVLVREARRAGHPVVFGDGASEPLLKRAGIERCRMLCVTLPDHLMERAVIRLARRINPRLFILVRGRRGAEDEELYRDGADEVVHETFEVGIEFLARILRRLSYPKQAVERQIGRLRSGRYEIFRRTDFTPQPLTEVARAMETMRVEFLEIPAGSPLAGRSLKDAGIRDATGALVLAVVRDGRPIPSPEAWFVLQENDTILVSGAAEQVAAVEDLLGS